jgi:hypothetical protein
MDKILVPTLRVSFGVVNGPSPRGTVTGLRRKAAVPPVRALAKVNRLKAFCNALMERIRLREVALQWPSDLLAERLLPSVV